MTPSELKPADTRRGYAWFSYAEILLVLAVGIGLANSALAERLAEIPRRLGASEMVAMTLAWAAINGVQLAAGLAVVYRRYGSLAGPLMLARPTKTHIGAGVGWGLAKAVFTTILVVALPTALTSDGGGEGGYPAGTFVAQLCFAFFFGAIASPFYEEVLYRGIVFNGIAARMPATAAILLVSTVFALAHLPRVFNTISAFFAGLLFAWLLQRYRNLWVPIVAHVVSNGTMTIAAFAAVNSA
ncbi:CPBP family intramembrane metalloprotease [Rhodococcus pyridinivorans]|uniref:CPBP family intramembrane glutamic endopeptidase n=1 Tax=Rhodococcus pyridinivorans TaxID=103816 RepID=UPI001E5AEE6D|nr:CPBP family intramembrane glutamic endopeptidase [Rhodococcus pyridinivorans]MCD5418016.1 CPBP family intramembrane metalloprotease [Rhodococcus pyridinivorans]